MSLLLLVLLLLLIAINGFFVAAEFALVRTRRGKIEQLAKEGESGAEAVVEQLDKIDESLSACQVGVTMASIGIGFLGEPSLAKLLGARLRRALPRGRGRPLGGARLRGRHRAAHQHRRAGAEDAGDRHPERIARRVSRPLNWFRAISAPVVFALSRFSNCDHPPLRRQPNRHRGAPHRRGRSVRSSTAQRSEAPSIPARRECSAASFICTSRRRAR